MTPPKVARGIALPPRSLQPAWGRRGRLAASADEALQELGRGRALRRSPKPGSLTPPTVTVTGPTVTVTALLLHGLDALDHAGDGAP